MDTQFFGTLHQLLPAVNIHSSALLFILEQASSLKKKPSWLP
jgi:hypothetical protein